MRVGHLSPDSRSQESRPSRGRRATLHGRRIAALSIVTVAILATTVASASALIVHLNGKALSYEPVVANQQQSVQPFALQNNKSASAKPLVYHGGPVMSSNTNYALYWDPAAGASFPAGYELGLDRYFEDLAHDSGGVQNTDSVLTQYTDEAGELANYNSHFGGALSDTDPYPANGCSAASICLTEEQLQAEVSAYVQAHDLPTDLEHEYFILTPPGVESCFEAASRSCSAGSQHPSYCAYHTVTTSAGIVFADDPYVAGTNCDTGEEHPNGNASDATIGGGLAHEHSESVTDPRGDAWFDSKGNEVGDKCRTFKQSSEFGEPLGQAPDGSNYNQVISGDLYWYQQEWSNEAGGCSQRRAQLPKPPAVTHVAPKTGHAAGGTSVTITGTSFSTGATVKFGANPASEVTVASSTSITAVSPPGATGTVDVVVTTSAGASAINKKDHFKYKH